jgi:nucleotide-binding universal stress UspA family protein
MFKKILCPVDLKDQTKPQLAFARSFAADQNATLSAIYVTQPPLYAYGYLALSELEERWDNIAREQMSEVCANDVEILLGRGWVGKEVAEVALSGEFDLLMVPTHEQRDTKELLVGSHFQAILNASSLPIVALPPALLSQKTVEFRKPKRILCAVDMDPSAGRIVQTAKRLADEYGAQTVLVHSVQIEERILDLLDSGKRDGVEQRMKEKLLNEIPAADRVQPTIIALGRADRNIQKIVQDNNIDLLILGFSHSHFRLRSVLYKTLMRLAIPCLCVPLD